MTRVLTHQPAQQRKEEAEADEEVGEKVEAEAEANVEKQTEGVSPKKEKEGEKGAEKKQLYFAGWRVLVVDDCETDRELLKTMFCTGPFEDLSWQVETATTAEEALAKIDGERTARGFDLVVFGEIVAPKGGLLGTEATRILRKKDERMLIVGLSEAATNESRERSLESGQDLLWLKPMPTAEHALKNIMRALTKRRLEMKVDSVGGEAGHARVVGRLEEKHDNPVKRDSDGGEAGRGRAVARLEEKHEDHVKSDTDTSSASKSFNESS